MNISENIIVWMTSAAILGGIVSGCGSTGEKKGGGSGERQPVAVKVIEADMSGNHAAKTYIGIVHPEKSTVLSCTYPGTLAELHVRQGQAVKKGEVIASINSQKVASSLEMAAATLEQAQDGYRRAKAVHESGSITDVKMVEVETKLKQAEAAYRAAEEASSACMIKAPYTGIIGEVYADSGVELGVAEPVVKIMDISSLEIRFSVPEAEIASMQPGMEAEFSVPATGCKGLKARLTSKGISASALSHGYECVIVPSSKVDGLMPGMVCKVGFPDGRDGVATLPSVVIKTDVSGRYVWAVRDGRAVKLPVGTGGFSGKGVVITEGLEDGELVIAEGAQKVSTGMKVKIVE